MIEVGRLHGIPLRVGASWLLVFALISWTLASYYLPYVLPDSSSLAHWVLAIVATTLLFGSIVLHELSHAVVAERHGVVVHGITLHLLGGVAQLEDEPPTARAELLIASAGPLTSFALAALCFTAGRLVSSPAWVPALLGYLAVVNTLIGGFNLLPGLPLDGGRVLRAALWRWRNDMDWATAIAARSGAGLGLALLGVGLVGTLRGAGLGGLWLVLMGWFLCQAARGSYELAVVRRRLQRLRVDDVLARAQLAREVPPASTADGGVGPHDSAWTAFLRIARSGRGRVAVVDGEQFVGVVRVEDLQRAAAANGSAERPSVWRWRRAA